MPGRRLLRHVAHQVGDGQGRMCLGALPFGAQGFQVPAQRGGPVLGVGWHEGAVGQRVCCQASASDQLHSALRKASSNVLRHTPATGEVAVHAFADDSEAVITVSDTGPGIDPGDLPHVFDRFWRADRSRTRHTGGSGLGLPIVRHLVEAHGGTVTAQSPRGAVFTVRIPRGLEA
jgi:signal transduction histidine kinase